MEPRIIAGSLTKQKLTDTQVPRTSKVHRIIFNPTISYDEVLLNFRDEFDKAWEKIIPSPETGLDGYTEMSTLGTGCFGVVVLVKQRQSYWAVKKFIKDEIVKTKQVIHVHRERKVMTAVRFPFLINLKFSAKDFDYLYLGMPFLVGGDMFSYQCRVRKFNEKQARFYAAQILMGLEYMHFLQLVYRDLKPENILIECNGYIKISDFSFTKKIQIRTSTLCGTPEYMAPEMIQLKPYGPSVDWWSFGCLLYELVAGCSPFSQHNSNVLTMYAKICDVDYKMPSHFSVSLKDLIKQLLERDISRRIGNLPNGVKDIKEHDWFRTINWYSILNQEVTPPYIPEVENLEDLSHFDKIPDPIPLNKSKTNRHADLFLDF